MPSNFTPCQITLVVFARWPSGPSGPVGAAGALAAAVTKAISAKGRRPAAANTLLYELIDIFFYLRVYCFRAVSSYYSYIVDSITFVIVNPNELRIFDQFQKAILFSNS